jgi:hypothetical protein
MDTQNNTLTIREYPLALWIFGLVLLAVAGYTAPGIRSSWAITLITGVAGLLFFLFAAVLVVEADRMRGTLVIRRTSPLRRYVREIPVSSIAALQVDSHASSEVENGRTRTSTAYRIVVITKDNETIPFRTAYTSGASAKEARARKLREFLGVGGADTTSLGGIIRQATGMAQQAFQERQESLTGPEAEEHVTEGVHWKLQTVAFGATAITRWFSPDQQCTSGFICLAQKVAGQALAAGGLLGGVSKLLYREVIQMNGFGSQETPGLDSADVLASFEPQLDPYFAVFTSDPAAAHQYLNPWSVAPLVDWATRYPLKQIQSTRGLFGQLIVMICPTGTYVASSGNMIPEAVQELTNLGVALVKGK